MAGFFDLEPLIVARLQETLGAAAPHVLAAEDLQGVVEQQQFTPAVHVLYRSYSVEQAQKDAAVIRQSWWLVAAARNVRNVQSGEGARKAVSPLVDGIFAAMTGWSPPVCNGAWFRPEQPGLDSLITGGFVYVPTLWSVRWVV